jgi:hypothetical protein
MSALGASTLVPSVTPAKIMATKEPQNCQPYLGHSDKAELRKLLHVSDHEVVLAGGSPE